MKLERQVTKGDLSAITPLIASFVHATWSKLPAYAKSYMSIEDLMQEGSNHLSTYVVKMYRSNNKKKQVFRQGQAYAEAQFITYAHKALENYFKDVLTEVYADKRFGKVISADSSVAVYKSGREVNLFDALRTIHDVEYNELVLIHRLDAEKAFLQVYAQASPHLRKHLINWCIQPAITKYKLTGSKFQKALMEFREQGFEKMLLPEYIQTIQSDAICRYRVVRQVVKNPGFRTISHRKVLEEQLLAAMPESEDVEITRLEFAVVGV